MYRQAHKVFSQPVIVHELHLLFGHVTTISSTLIRLQERESELFFLLICNDRIPNCSKLNIIIIIHDLYTCTCTTFNVSYNNYNKTITFYNIRVHLNLACSSFSRVEKHIISIILVQCTYIATLEVAYIPHLHNIVDIQRCLGQCTSQ